jgi:preprotein translocase subunit YajC
VPESSKGNGRSEAPRYPVDARTLDRDLLAGVYRGGHSRPMHGDDLPDILSVVAIVLTLVVIWFAQQTVREARKATQEERNAVNELRELVTTVGGLAASTTQLVGSAEISSVLASAAGERDKLRDLIERLKSMLKLVYEINNSAYERAATGPEYAFWTCPEQQDLGATLQGIELDLPGCKELARAYGTHSVYQAAPAAAVELQNMLHDLGASWS